MTDKKIIIDGVDVSECVSFVKLNEQNICCYEDTREDKIPFANFCVENKDCYYKQLQKEKFENLNNRQMVESAENLIYKNSELYKNLKEKEQECKELKRKVELMMDCVDCKVDDYKQALDEIEKYINSQGINHKWNMYIQRFRSGILDIITKAKDGDE